MTTDMICDGANKKHIKRKRLNSMGAASSKHPKHLNNTKKTQTRASDDEQGLE